ncbi:RNA-binding S4 domain-containing protein [Holzapfeliella sp. He02]|uniref:RQC P-site tRNA stabilizing factor n=1 Tax=Holzapfeliella saturejae TaxID=3082953 RepID=A0ABU8SFA7_9LACO
MRIDRFLKVSRIIKRRTIAKEMADQGRIKVNDKVIKSSSKVQIGDILEVTFGNRTIKARILNLLETTKKAEAQELYELVD